MMHVPTAGRLDGCQALHYTVCSYDVRFAARSRFAVAFTLRIMKGFLKRWKFTSRS